MGFIWKVIKLQNFKTVKMTMYCICISVVKYYISVVKKNQKL